MPAGSVSQRRCVPWVRRTAWCWLPSEGVAGQSQAGQAEDSREWAARLTHVLLQGLAVLQQSTQPRCLLTAFRPLPQVFGSGRQSSSPHFPIPALGQASCLQLPPHTALTARSGWGSTAQMAAPRSAGRPRVDGGWRCRHRRSESTSETGSLGAS